MFPALSSRMFVLFFFFFFFFFTSTKVASVRNAEKGMFISEDKVAVEEATRSGTEKRCSHNLQSGQSAGKSAAFQGGGVFSHDFNFGFEL